jgi:hypothetical protein
MFRILVGLFVALAFLNFVHAQNLPSPEAKSKALEIVVAR